MNHSLKVISEFICSQYGMMTDDLHTHSAKDWRINRVRYIILWIAGYGRDADIADTLRISESTVRVNRRVMKGYLQVGTIKQSEIDELKNKLIKYEIT